MADRAIFPPVVDGQAVRQGNIARWSGSGHAAGRAPGEAPHDAARGSALRSICRHAGSSKGARHALRHGRLGVRLHRSRLDGTGRAGRLRGAERRESGAGRPHLRRCRHGREDHRPRHDRAGSGRPAQRVDRRHRSRAEERPGPGPGRGGRGDPAPARGRQPHDPAGGAQSRPQADVDPVRRDGGRDGREPPGAGIGCRQRLSPVAGLHPGLGRLAGRPAARAAGAAHRRAGRSRASPASRARNSCSITWTTP